MIPKSLLTTFLSLKIATFRGAPPPTAHHEVEGPAQARPVDSHRPYDVPEVHNVEPAREVQYDVKLEDVYYNKQQQPITVEASKDNVAMTEQHVFPVCTRSGNFHMCFFRPSK